MRENIQKQEQSLLACISDSQSSEISAVVCLKDLVVSDGRSLEDLARELSVKSDQGYKCSLCGQPRADFSAMKDHMEACHFPSSVGYTCQICYKVCKTKHALTCHNSIYHRQRKQ